MPLGGISGPALAAEGLTTLRTKMNAKLSTLVICTVGAAIAMALLIFASEPKKPDPRVLTVNSPAEMSSVMRELIADRDFSARVEFPVNNEPTSQRAALVDGRSPTEAERADILGRANSMALSCKRQLEELKNDGDEFDFSYKMAQANQIAETSRAAVLSIDKAFICDRAQPLLEDNDEVYYWGVLLPFRDKSGADVAYVPIDLKAFPSAAGALRALNDLKAYRETEQSNAWNSQPFSERRAKCDAAQAARVALKETQREFLTLSASNEALTPEQIERLRVLREVRAALEIDAAAVPGSVNIATAEWIFRNVRK